MARYYIQRTDIHQAVVDADSEEEALSLAENPNVWELLTSSEDEIVEIQ